MSVSGRSRRPWRRRWPARSSPPAGASCAPRPGPRTRAASSSATLVSATSRPRPMTTRWSAVSSQLAHQVAGDEHRPALGRQRRSRPPDPDDALGVEPVDRLVEHQHRRVAEQRRGDAQPLPHAEREAAGPASGDRRGRARPARAPRRPGGAAMPLLCASHSRWSRALRPGCSAPASSSAPTCVSGVRSDRYGLPPTSAVALVGRVQSEDQPHRGGLAGAVGPDEPGDLARPHGERQPVDGDRRPVPLAQPRPRWWFHGWDATEPARRRSSRRRADPGDPWRGRPRDEIPRGRDAPGRRRGPVSGTMACVDRRSPSMDRRRRALTGGSPASVSRRLSSACCSPWPRSPRR